MTSPIPDVRKLTVEEYQIVKAEVIRAEHTDRIKREDARQLAAMWAKHPDLVLPP